MSVRIRDGILAAGIAILLASCGGGGSSGGDKPLATVQITGTAARGAPITSATVTIKDKNGVIKTGTTDSNGKFTIDVSGLTTPLLMRISNGNDYLYSVATAAGTTNIHPYTDLIIKNWFLVNGSSVESQFTGSAALTAVPTATEINTIEAVINSLLSANMSNASVPSGFNLLTSSFDANSTGFDKVLDNTQVVIDTATGGVTVTATDATTGITGTVVSTAAPITTAADTTVPSTPAGLAALPASTTSIVLTWDASTDNVGVAGYNVYRGSSKIATSPYPVYIDTGRTSGTQYCYKVEAFDGAGNVSAAQSSQACATPPASADTTVPSVPSGLTATAVSSSQIDLSWTASTDNVGVMGYAVYRGATKVATVNGTSYSDIGLAADTQYSYTVQAVDATMNTSAASTSASATTLLQGSGASPIGPNSATGTYTWDAGTGTLTLTTTSSNFVCSGPKMGADPIGTGITITSTTMTWLPPDSTTWTRSTSGAANDIVGTWTATMQNGLPFTLIFYADGSYSGSGTDECANAWANFGAGSYSVGLEYRDPSVTGVSVAGPGITGSVALTYNASFGTWGDVGNQSYQVALGSTNPTGLPYTYTFTVTTASGTRTETTSVTCFPQEFVTNIAPTGTATGAITFSWTGIAGAGAIYGVYMQDPVIGTWNNWGLTGTSVAYNGPALTPGTTYNYSVNASPSTCSNGSTYVVGSFTYQ